MKDLSTFELASTAHRSDRVFKMLIRSLKRHLRSEFWEGCQRNTAYSRRKYIDENLEKFSSGYVEKLTVGTDMDQSLKDEAKSFVAYLISIQAAKDLPSFSKSSLSLCSHYQDILYNYSHSKNKKLWAFDVFRVIFKDFVLSGAFSAHIKSDSIAS